jgi:LmbE family N-acetylglucosaminyl deacetylase
MEDKGELSTLFNNAAVIVAHPDDETLWCGGTVLLNLKTKWTVISLCRKSDQERSQKFYRMLNVLHLSGAMGDLDDGPEQLPLQKEEVQHTILRVLPVLQFDLVLTHSPYGEYTRHRRHEEVSEAVIKLWQGKKISIGNLWMFAYEDGNRSYLPKAIGTADRVITLPQDIWKQKYNIITEIYGFLPDSFEARTTPTIEAFWCFTNPEKVYKWIEKGG